MQEGEIAFADRLVIREHQPSYTENVLTAPAGAELRVEREDAPENPGWFWAASEERGEGWVHESFFERTGGESAVLKQPYTARELAVRVGDPVVVLAERGRWAFIRTESGRTGWVPTDCLRVPPAQCRPW